MKRKSSKYLEFYKECMKTGKLPLPGLCSSFEDDVLLFHPNDEEIIGSYLYWGNGTEDWSWDRRYNFTPLRQTIVLFMHEMTINPIL